MMGDWEFDELPPSLVEQELTQRDQFNNDEVELAEALVREVIQNSSDAANGTGAVKVRFAVRELDEVQSSRLRTQFTRLRPHLNACEIDVAPIDRSCARLLVIEDFYTKGLTGNPAALDDDNFHNFWRRHGGSSKQGKAGGRWGLGKLVFSCSSEVRAFFGLTVRGTESTPLLMGQAVLSNHKLNAKRYPAHGFWFECRAPDGLQLPVTTASDIRSFSELAGVTRIEQTGLSLVIPYLNRNITEQTIIAAAVRNYYFPILAGRLIVEVGSVLINRSTFHSVAGSVLDGKMATDIPLSFVEQVSRHLAAAPLVVASTEIDGSALTEKTFSGEQLNAMRAVFVENKLLHVRVAVRLKRKNGTSALSHVDLFLRQLPESGHPFALYARGSITVPSEIRYFSGCHAYGALVASDEGIAAFLGDAENPAHTAWNANAEKLAARWRSPSQTLRHIRHSLRDLYLLVSARVAREDRDALIDFFSLIDPARSGKGPKKRTPVQRPEIQPREKALSIDARAGGFVLMPGPGASKWKFPAVIDMRVAYDMIGADPFKRHSKFDFDLSGSGIEIDAKNLTVNPIRPNKLRLSVTSADFRLHASGFDPNRDLVVDARTVT